MLHPLPTPAEMALWDRETIETIGIPGVTLMESASREAVTVLLNEYGPVTGRTIFCFAGPGNNGGDAFAMARQLIDLDAVVTVFHSRPKKQYRGETRTNLLWAQKLGVPLKHLTTIDIATLSQPDIIIDGLLGTGFEGFLRPDMLALVQTINHMRKKSFIISIDIPSGLNGSTGKPQPESIIADTTVSFQAAKLGLAMPEAAPFIGKLHVRPIGIPQFIQKKHPARHHLISQEIMGDIPSPARIRHKGDAGHVLIIGGSKGLTGAPHLAALGALRSGAGLVTIACPATLTEAVKAGSPDIMTLPLGSGDEWEPVMTNNLLPLLNRFDSVVIGPGIGRDGKTVDFLKAFIAECPPRTVLDADALYGLAQNIELIASLSPNSVLTPHPAEMARLIGISTAEIQANRLGTIDSFVEKCAAVLVLKGAGTLVATKATTCLSPFSEPNLSIGGSGDVLSGIIACLLAQKVPSLHAACLGVYWHGLTGRLLKEKFPVRGNLASEIANMLPTAAKMIAKEFPSC